MREIWLQLDQVCHATAREAKTTARKQIQLHEQQLHQAAAREAETPDQHHIYKLTNRAQHAAATARAWVAKLNDAFSYDCTLAYELNPSLTIGRISECCQFCSALKWKHESPGMCCSSGKVRLPPILPPPEPLYSLLLGESVQSKAFLKSIWLYNSLFSMTSFAAHEVKHLDANIQDSGSGVPLSWGSASCSRRGSCLSSDLLAWIGDG